MKEFAKAEWSRAQRTLETARQLAQADPDSAASRAYYAAFHALTAYFALKNCRFSKHSALRAAVHRDLVQPALVSQDFGQDYDVLIALRDTGDYGGRSSVSVNDATVAVVKAEAILAMIGPLLAM